MKKKVELVNNHHQSISYAIAGYRTLKISIKNAIIESIIRS